MIEAFNKVLKHQFLYPKSIINRVNLENAMAKAIMLYNYSRPQYALGGNTPDETFNGKPINLNKYKESFKHQRAIRVLKNQVTVCKKCK